MDKKLKELLEESIKLERNVGGIYLLFSELYEQDSGFWWKLHNEENNHAALLRSVLDVFIPFNQYPEKMICDSLEELQAANKYIEDVHIKFKDNHPDRDEAFRTAMEIESSAGELHFQDFMKSTSDNGIDEIFRKLNSEDIDHYNRIKFYRNKGNRPKVS